MCDREGSKHRQSIRLWFRRLNEIKLEGLLKIMSFKNIPFGSPEEFNALIEIPKGSQNKYEYNEESDEIELDWVFTNDFSFPFNYGLIPETRGGDGDHLDVFVIGPHSINMGAIVKNGVNSIFHTF